MARKSFKGGALAAPLPPVLVTVSDGERTNALTIAWTGILSTHPPRTYISVRPSRYSYKMLRATMEFVINLPTADMARTVDYIGIYTGAKVDKIEKCGLTLAPSKEVAVPTISECPIALECRVVEVIPMGTHDVFIADILSVSADEGVIDEAGKLRFDLANLLAYAHGEYYALGDKLGEFGFSAKKSGTKKKTAARRDRGDGEGTVTRPTDPREERREPPKGKTKKRGGSAAPRDAAGERGSAPEEEKKPFYVSAPGYKIRGRSKK